MMFLLAFLACGEPEIVIPEPEVVQASPLRAGAAAGHLLLPIGTPLGCFTARCIPGTSTQDRRETPYNVAFDPSTGIHDRPVIKAIWLQNEQEDVVLVKTDLCMSSDHLIREISDEVNQRLGVNITGNLMLSVSHSHSSYGAYQDSWHFLLGTDRRNEEILRRSVKEFADVIVEAHSKLEPAAIGTAWAFDWDPNNQIYSDRRGINNDLKIWDDQGDWETGKDPHLNSLRIDDLEGNPIAFAFTFGVHGIIFDGDSPIVSRDSSGGIETVVEEEFPADAVVMHLQGSGGDASPRGKDTLFARTESLGELARDPVMELYNRTPTGSEPVELHAASRSIWQLHDQIEVTRDGTVDMHYRPYEDGYEPDREIFNDDGSIIEEIDEFNTPNGAAFCQNDNGAQLGDQIDGVDGLWPYSSCSQLDEAIPTLLINLFKYEEEELTLPLPETSKATTGVARLGPIATGEIDGTEVQRDLFMGFMPGEPLALYGEQWRRRVEAELGHKMPLLVGYSQDHEGYLLIPEDWLAGDYEAYINAWGPLQGEHIMEGALTLGKDVVNADAYIDPDPYGYWAPPAVPDLELPSTFGPPTAEEHPAMTPDVAPDAGTRLTEAPEYFWVHKHFRDGRAVDHVADLSPFPSTVKRGDFLQFGWIGGDPMVDPPHVYLETKNDAGEWERATSKSGRVISEAMTDIVVGYTPFPLAPVVDDQTHYYWAAWQAVGHVHDRLGLAEGTYRLKVEGQTYVGSEKTWPWTSEPYEMATEEFVVEPAALTLELAVDDGGLWVSYDAPEWGFRLIDLEGNARGSNPIRGDLTLNLDGTETTVTIDTITDGRAWVPAELAGVTSITITDPYGNSGNIEDR